MSSFIYVHTNLNIVPSFLPPSFLISDMYSSMCLSSKAVNQQLAAIRSQIGHEVKYQRAAFDIMGIVDTLLTAGSSDYKAVNLDDSKIRKKIVDK